MAAMAAVDAEAGRQVALRRCCYQLLQDRKSTRLNSSHTVISTLSLHDALPISMGCWVIRWTILSECKIHRRHHVQKFRTSKCGGPRTVGPLGPYHGGNGGC